MIQFLEENGLDTHFYALVTVIIAAILYKVIAFIVKKRLKYKKGSKDNKVRNTYIAMVGNIARYFYIAIVAIVILQIYGVNITAMVAGLSVFSAVAGLALQDTLKDIIKGFSLITEDFVKIGDYVKVGDLSGKVVNVGVRSIKIKNGLTGDISTIANSEVTKASTFSNLINADVPLPHELKLAKAEEVINEIVERTLNLPTVAKCEYRGISKLGDHAIEYRVYIKCSDNRAQTNRDFNRIVLSVLEENKISLPYQQLDIHTKK